MARFAGVRLDRAALSSLTAFLGRRPGILAWAATCDGWVIGLAGSMVIGDGESWRAFPWHQIATGQWDAATARLTWLDADGAAHAAELEAGARFAELFNERVSASVVISRRVDLGPGQQVTLALRRNLEPGADETAWQVTPGPGVDLLEPSVQARVDQELAAAQADFGLA